MSVKRYAEYVQTKSQNMANMYYHTTPQLVSNWICHVNLYFNSTGCIFLRCHSCLVYETKVQLGLSFFLNELERQTGNN